MIARLREACTLIAVDIAGALVLYSATGSAELLCVACVNIAGVAGILVTNYTAPYVHCGGRAEKEAEKGRDVEVHFDGGDDGVEVCCWSLKNVTWNRWLESHIHISVRTAWHSGLAAAPPECASYT